MKFGDKSIKFKTILKLSQNIFTNPHKLMYVPREFPIKIFCNVISIMVINIMLAFGQFLTKLDNFQTKYIVYRNT